MSPVQDVIDALEVALQEARDGRIRAIGLAIVKCDQETSTRFACDPDEAISHSLTAATAYLHGRHIAHKLGLHEVA